MRSLRIQQLLPPSDACHFAISDLRTTGEMHTHDFHELFWVRGGQGIHSIGGQRRPLDPGMLVLIRADDAHFLVVPPNGSLRICNLAFPVSHWEQFRSRYLPDQDDPFARPLEERTLRLAGVAFAQLQQAADELSAGRRTVAAMDRFLLNLLHILRSDRSPDTALPDWLAGAIRGMSSPQRLRDGTPALVDLSGRSPEHVSRTVHKLLGKTPTDLVNDLRLTIAAQQLAQTSHPIAAIAEEVGLSNLSHFYRLFQAKHSQTPAQYRRSQQMVVSARL
jgi:AraC family cel operon transcriptional repressor